VASIFTRIIRGELPGRIVYRDERAVAFLTIEPLAPGHTLVVPIEEIDHWIDLDPDLAAHLMKVAQKVGRAIDEVYRPRKVGLTILGLEVPHAHIHVSAIDSERDLDFALADRSPRPEDLDEAADRIRAALGE
jgi:histidine triad (HIT) family protein